VEEWTSKEKAQSLIHASQVSSFMQIRMSRGFRISIFLLLCTSALPAQESKQDIDVNVHADKITGSLRPVWNYFGYDEPNYTYAPNGKKLLSEIAALSPVPAYIRVHNLLTSGDGSASPKWGSTGVYTEDAAGKPIYNWAIVDQIFETFHTAGVKPLVEIGFMPEALSTNPHPYRHSFPQGSIFTGWAYPPTDYQKWAELVFQFVQHLRQKYGDAEVKTWLWEVWNEPDIEYWKGTPQEFFKLYDYSVDAVRRALPGAQVGGPDTTGPGRPKAAEFLKQFLNHCDTGRNYATGKTGVPLDFISFHPKGSPSWQGDHVQMGIATQLTAIDQGFKIVSGFPKWRNTPIILGESDPEGCAACSAQQNQQNGYRNGPLYASYTAEAIYHTLSLAGRDHINLAGIVTWAFEFEDQPYFAGFRELATNGLNKPVLNAFRMFGILSDKRIEVTNSAALDSEEVVRNGVRTRSEINAIASRNERELAILVWNYHDDDLPAEPASIQLTITGLPAYVQRVLLEEFRVDSNHSNAFAEWKIIGSPQSPSSEQYQKLEKSGQLQMADSPRWIAIEQGKAQLKLTLPRQALSLIRLGW
jgi:xylan 1,4-beta-xylosidase